MAKFKVGDQVVWVRAVPEPHRAGIQGIVLSVKESDEPLAEQFTRYEIQFPFGKATLYGTQIEPVPEAFRPYTKEE